MDLIEKANRDENHVDFQFDTDGSYLIEPPMIVILKWIYFCGQFCPVKVGKNGATNCFCSSGL